LRLVQLRFQFGAFSLLAVHGREIAQDAGKMAMASGPPFGNRQMRRKNEPSLRQTSSSMTVKRAAMIWGGGGTAKSN